MTGPWHIAVDRVVVTGAPRGLDASELRVLVGNVLGERLRTADLPAGRRMATAVRVEAGRMAGGSGAVADRVAGAIVGAVSGRHARD